MSADTLSAPARSFYENTRSKLAASIFLAAMAMMSLAYVSSYGGESNSAHFMANFHDNTNLLNDDSLELAQNALAGGYGFAAFMFFVAFAVFLTGAIYISPMFCGSPNEKKLIARPQEVDSGYASYTENPVNPVNPMNPVLGKPLDSRV